MYSVHSCFDEQLLLMFNLQDLTYYHKMVLEACKRELVFSNMYLETDSDQKKEEREHCRLIKASLIG